MRSIRYSVKLIIKYLDTRSGKLSVTVYVRRIHLNRIYSDKLSKIIRLRSFTILSKFLFCGETILKCIIFSRHDLMQNIMKTPYYLTFVLNALRFAFI